jgi:hypothetical protein
MFPNFSPHAQSLAPAHLTTLSPQSRTVAQGNILSQRGRKGRGISDSPRKATIGFPQLCDTNARFQI